MGNPRKIDDHSFWAGKPSKGSVFPEGVKIKHEFSANGAGELDQYQDSSEAIMKSQEMGQRKVKSYPAKPEYRH